MRALAALLLVPVAALAQPPVVKDFVRIRKFRENLTIRLDQLTQAEEFAQKPREEKMLIAFERGEKTFEGKPFTGKTVVETCLLKWPDVLQATPTDAGKRVLKNLPDVFGKRFGVLDVVKKDRYEASDKLIDALDNDFLQVRIAAFEALKKIYRTSTGFMYEPTMSREERKKSIKEWDRHVKKANQK